MQTIREIGAYAGFAAVIGLAVLAALYFSQARDVKRLREWAGRAPERAAEQQAAAVPGQARPAVRQPGAPAPAVRPVPAGARGQPAKTGAPPGKTPGKPAAAPTPVPAQAGARPAAATAAGAAAPGKAAPETGEGANAGGAATPAARPGNAVTPLPRPDEKQPARRPGGRSPQQTRVIPAAAVRRGGGGGAAPREPDEKRSRSRYLVPAVVAGVVVVVAVIAGTQLLGGGSNKPAKHATKQATEQKKQNSKASTPAVDPTSITVAVLNGTTVQGLGAQIGDKVQSGSFQLGNVTNATAQGERAESVAMYAPGHKADARAVARKLGISQIEPVDAQSQALAGDATVIVVVGLDQTQ
jgi:LytR cell envelope-related transcriptional attenuator